MGSVKEGYLDAETCKGVLLKEKSTAPSAAVKTLLVGRKEIQKGELFCHFRSLKKKSPTRKKHKRRIHWVTATKGKTALPRNRGGKKPSHFFRR